jgi:MFS family permease
MISKIKMEIDTFIRDEVCDVPRRGAERQPPYATNAVWLLRYRAALASNVYAIFWPVYLTRDLRISVPDALGLISLAIILSLVLEVPTGWLADRYDHKATLLAGTALSMLGVAMYATATRLGPYLFAALVIDHLGGGLASGPDTALATDTSHAIGEDLWENVFRDYAEKRVNYTAIGRGAGGLAGAAAAVGFGLRATLWAQVAAYGLAFVCAWCVKTPPRRDEKIAHLGRVALSLLRRRRLLAVIGFSGAIGGLLIYSYWFLSLYCAQVRFGGRPLPLGWFGVIWSAFMISPWLFNRYCRAWFLRHFERYNLRSLLALTAIAVASMAAAGSWVSVPGLAAILGIYFVNALQRPVMDTAMMRLANPAERATIGSAGQFAILAIAAGFSLLTSVMTRSYSFGTSLAGIGLLSGLIATVSLAAMAGPEGRHIGIKHV